MLKMLTYFRRDNNSINSSTAIGYILEEYLIFKNLYYKKTIHKKKKHKVTRLAENWVSNKKESFYII